MPTVCHFARNTEGTDYTVGDLHGCFSFLQKTLDNIGFDPSKDRLFCVGDLVDRGPESEQALEYLQKPWFFSVRGNHEQLCIDVYDNPKAALENHIANGGIWYCAKTRAEQQPFRDAFDELAIMFTIDTPFGVVGIVHADVPGLTDWHKAVVEISQKDDYAMTQALWGRTRIKKELRDRVENIAFVYCGHTIVAEPAELGNVRFIDTGAWLEHENRPLTLVNLHNGEIIEARREYVPAMKVEV